MGKRAENQITVELAPSVRQELRLLQARGEILSVQDFVRHAIDEKLERRKVRGPPIPESSGPSLFVEGVRAKEEQARRRAR